jgi:cation diffusion facilitator family transporter
MLHGQANEKIRTQWWVLSLSLLLMTAKFTAYFITESNAILSDALESIVNIVAGGFGLFSLYLSAKPRDKDHPYGHGKIEFISATVEGILIIIAGIAIIYKAISGFINPSYLNDLGLGIALVAVSGILNYGMGLYAIRNGRKGHSLALEASGEHLVSDAYSTIGVVLGLLVIYWTKILWIDNVLALAMAFIIIRNGLSIVKRAVAGIMDEADFKLNKKVIAHIQAHRRPEWIDVHNFRVIKYGEVIHIDCHMTMPWYLSIRESHDGMIQLDESLKQSVANPVETFIHIDPCEPTSCSICAVENCAFRKDVFSGQIEWTLENVMRNKKHSR